MDRVFGMVATTGKRQGEQMTETIHDRLIIQRRFDKILGGEVWRDASTPLEPNDAEKKLEWQRVQHGADNVRLVRYVTTMEVVG